MALLSELQLRGRTLFPGLLLALTIAAAAKFLSEHYVAPVMLFALLIGMAFNFMADQERTSEGVVFASKTLLRLGIVLLGARITLGDIAGIGTSGLLTVAGLMALTIGFGFVCAKLFSRGWRFAILTGGAVAICGASAALALAAVIPGNDKTERNVLFTVVAVTTLSTIAMIIYPVLFALAGFNDAQSGFMIGATVHDVAQVVGAGYSISTEAGDKATIVKLLRVTLLPVVLIILALALARRESGFSQVRLPLFVIGFGAVTLANSIGLIPVALAALLVDASSWLLVIAIAALGVRTNMKAMLDLGWRHVAVIVVETVFLLGLAWVAVATGLAGI
ncbi:MAG: putative sulfate exporter family transporter [Hoeflea sp.]|uniref:YeiH family protein n=1 Tax=Hoeflea sp. TaxID=1940281 RepID=UPI001D4828B4|nr:putative sulfate exporter family transporter [Hoeflea sp.]MBU4531334.1 putative sulfate exporter family transporter [Alphaproteobacteria bacterium]MBU4544191.1 putative sulfate exporter family transporter [Alphaproteobacteria bacterium]MBU4550572.1 putative sulfate exporter family transporter [Alphaproteobacteria bacterium]MBV1724610.1 putative sulfate exporter family transporter [Hoeflea sp.]MBV1760630.1 putative sulfate exporter family transporter [Hoeflea sp.]